MDAFALVMAHVVGDYLIQTHWMATEKTHRWAPAVIHGVTYTLPHLVVTQSVPALLVIGGTHIVIDRYRLARYVVWFKNQFAPRSYRPPLTPTGYPADTPAWLAVWLMIVVDNTIHLLINTASVLWL
jgi:hypothetical protein